VSSLLIRNTCLYANARATARDGVDIVIDGDSIRSIAPHDAGRAFAGTIIDGTPFVTMPGLVNAHTHSNESFELGLYDAMPLELWLLYKYPPGAVQPVPERVHYLRTMLLAIDNVRSGITTVQDDLINPVFEALAFDGSAAAYRDIGLRATLTVSMGDRSLTAPLPWLAELMPAPMLAELEAGSPTSAALHFARFEQHFARWHGAAQGRMRVIPGPIGPQWCSDALLQRAAAIAAERDLGVHTHTLESRLHAIEAQQLYGCTLIEHLDRLGVLSPRLTLNHAIWLTDDDIARLAAHGCSITHNPASNLKLGSGVARVPELLRAGVNVALGTDGTSTADRSDLFRSLGLAAMLHRIGSHDCDTWPTAEDAVHMATAAGARSAGWDSGEIAPGRKADLVLLARDDFAFLGTDALASRLAFATSAEAVDTVIVGGEVIMQGRQLQRVNEAALRREIGDAAREHLERHVRPGHEAARRFAPYFKAVLARAASEPVAAPVPALRLRPPFSAG
jgi:5-methylthioadenosine/S-adenosylhomocysteine deaminase